MPMPVTRLASVPLRPLACRLAASLAIALIPLPALSQGEVILTVTGLDPTRHPMGIVQFDSAEMEALGAVTFTTSSIWTEGPHAFTGVPLATLAKALDLPPQSRITLHALNDYEVEMPLAEATPDAPILAYRMDGKPMSVRDKGPIWVVYPYDADPKAWQTVTAFARSVWQLDRIEVAP